MNIKGIAEQKYFEFSKYEGCQHIAKEHALYRILQVLKVNSADCVLEIGLGIGTIFSAVNEFNSNIKYYGTEDNVFCLNSLKQNLNTTYQSLNVYASIKKIPHEVKFDMVIIDGKDDSLNEIKKYLKNDATIVIEGDRVEQENSIKELFPNSKSVHVITLKKNKPDGYYNSNNYQGGVKVIFINPNIKQLMYWIKNKILTSIKYKIRKLKMK